MEIVEIFDANELKNEYFQARYGHVYGTRSRAFVNVIDGKQSGILIYDEYKDSWPTLGFVMEINVLQDARRQGIARELLIFSEKLSIASNFSFIALDAYPLDQGVDKEWLVSWYEKNGFVQESAEGDRMRKNLTVL